MEQEVGIRPALYYEYRAPWLAPLGRKDITDALTLMQAASGLDKEQIELHLIDDRTSAALNSQFLSCPGPTNIITFPPGNGAGGYLFLSLDTFARECWLYGQNRTRHFLRLLAHGFGHLGGLEHGERMERIEQACFEASLEITKKR